MIRVKLIKAKTVDEIAKVWVVAQQKLHIKGEATTTGFSGIGIGKCKTFSV